jgi:phosphinothricin acetyltransferase
VSVAARIRRATPDDAAGVAAIYAPIVLDSAISFELEPPSATEMGRRIHATVETLPWLVCHEGDEPLGYAYASTHRARAAYRWSVEVSVYVAGHQRGRGVGAGLYEALLALLELQGFHRALAGITLPNPASVALHEHVGFTAVGVYREVGFKRGAWHDVGWWERPLAP